MASPHGIKPDVLSGWQHIHAELGPQRTLNILARRKSASLTSALKFGAAGAVLTLASVFAPSTPVKVVAGVGAAIAFGVAAHRTSARQQFVRIQDTLGLSDKPISQQQDDSQHCPYKLEVPTTSSTPAP